jgi:hypothetical protein
MFPNKIKKLSLLRKKSCNATPFGGLKHLKLWKSNGTSVIPIQDIDTACYRIAYIYANPATANLVDSILDYPGVSTYKDFMKDIKSLNATHTKNCPWVRQPMINQLPDMAITRADDLAICKEWQDTATESHQLITHPNAWMKCFGITEPDQILEVNNQILKYLTGLEKNARDKRQEKKQKVMGKAKLKSRPIDMSYRPKKKSGRIFVYALDPELRKYLIRKYKEFCDLCAYCYDQWKMNNFQGVWPPGAYYLRQAQSRPTCKTKHRKLLSTAN